MGAPPSLSEDGSWVSFSLRFTPLPAYFFSSFSPDILFSFHVSAQELSRLFRSSRSSHRRHHRHSPRASSLLPSPQSPHVRLRLHRRRRHHRHRSHHSPFH